MTILGLDTAASVLFLSSFIGLAATGAGLLRAIAGTTSFWHLIASSVGLLVAVLALVTAPLVQLGI